MDGADDLSTSTSSSSNSDHHSRPSVGFPLGTGLLLIIIFCISGTFSCCYHWEKMRYLTGGRRRQQSHHASHDHDDESTDAHAHQHHPPTPLLIHNISLPSPISSNKIPSKLKDQKQEKSQSLPVIMPGDNVPKFMAWPCPCPSTTQTITENKIVVVVCPTISSQSTQPL